MLELDSQTQPKLLHVEPRRLPIDADPLADRTCLLYRKAGGFSTAQVLRIDPAKALTGTRTNVAATSTRRNDESRYSTTGGEGSRASTSVLVVDAVPHAAVGGYVILYLVVAASWVGVPIVGATRGGRGRCERG